MSEDDAQASGIVYAPSIAEAAALAGPEHAALIEDAARWNEINAGTEV
jgi:hypothetical protein